MVFASLNYQPPVSLNIKTELCHSRVYGLTRCLKLLREKVRVHLLLIHLGQFLRQFFCCVFIYMKIFTGSFRLFVSTKFCCLFYSFRSFGFALAKNFAVYPMGGSSCCIFIGWRHDNDDRRFNEMRKPWKSFEVKNSRFFDHFFCENCQILSDSHKTWPVCLLDENGPKRVRLFTAKFQILFPWRPRMWRA